MGQLRIIQHKYQMESSLWKTSWVLQSPFLWITIIDNLLRPLTEKVFDPVCYEDDITILLNVNPNIPEICLFTDNTNIVSYEDPRSMKKPIIIVRCG